MAKAWFTSDTHFGSERTLELSKRPFETVEEMDQSIIDNWNNTVNKDDVVYHVGDFGDYEVAKKLNGKIKLIMGNYDKNEYESGKTDFNNKMQECGIEVVSLGIAIEIPCVDQEGRIRHKLGLQHEPLDAKKSMKANGYDFVLFGHIHKLQMVKSYGLNVGIDCHNFYPIDLRTVEFYKNAIENHYDENVFN